VIYSVAFSPVRDEFIQGMRYGDRPPPPAPIATPPPDSQQEPAVPDTVYAERAPLLEQLVPFQLLPIVNALRRNAASELAALSGGEYINFTTRKGFDHCLERIANRTHNYYLLSF